MPLYRKGFEAIATLGIGTLFGRAFQHRRPEPAGRAAPLVQRSFAAYLLRVLDTDILACRLSHFQRKFIEGGLLAVMMDWIADPRGNRARGDGRRGARSDQVERGMIRSPPSADISSPRAAWR